MFVVIRTSSFDYEKPCYLFNTYEEACDFLLKDWEEYYNKELTKGSKLKEQCCFHFEKHAQVGWKDFDYIKWEVLNLIDKRR